MFIKPDYNLKNIYEIDFQELKKQGIKCVMFDLDSTVMMSKSASFTEKTLDWFKTFINDFNVVIISNNHNKSYIENASK
jgi:predicted HAD superfamily phosphohydrolase YqeG